MRPHSLKFIITETGINFYAWDVIEAGFLFSPAVKRYCGQTVNIAAMKIAGGQGWWGVDLDNWCAVGRRLVDKITVGRFLLEDLAQGHLQCGNSILRLCSAMDRRDLQRVANREFARWFRAAWKLYAELSALGFVPVLSDLEHFYLTGALMEILWRRGVKDERLQSCLSVLSSQSEPTLFWREKLELLKICREFKTLQKIKKSADFIKHVKKYFWLNYGYEGPVWTDGDFFKRAGEILRDKKSVAEQYCEHVNYYRVLKKEIIKLEKQLNLSTREKGVGAVARTFMALKAYRTEIRHRFNYLSDKIFKELAQRFSLPLLEFHYALCEEILRILSGKRVNHKTIVARARLMLHVTANGRDRMVAPDKIEPFLEKFLMREKIKFDGVLRGQAAYLGKARGAVRIIAGVSDMPKMSQGDILVSTATNPDILPAMKKAAAFVTDTGGITCHAAIVARELKVPCVIGTKIATRVLKDGDIVEVDAEKGEVRKI